MNTAQGHLHVRRRPRNGNDGKPGEKGIPGCILRVSEWVPGVEFHNDEALTEGTRYLDIAVITTGSTTFQCYQCLKTHISSETLDCANREYWTPFNMLQPIFTPLILAQYAKLRMTQTNSLLVMKEDDTTVALGLGGGSYPLWIGAPNHGTAPFKVSIDGNMTAIGATIKRSVLDDVVVNGTFKAGIAQVEYTSNSTVITPDTYRNIPSALQRHDYINCTVVGSTGVTRDTLPFNDEYVGRRVYINAGYTDLELSGRFYHGGMLVQNVKLHRQSAEFFCTIINNQTCWLIVQINDLNSYTIPGLPWKTLAFGRVNTLDLANALYKTSDGSKLTFTPGAYGTDKKGHDLDPAVRSTIITIPDRWFPNTWNRYIHVSVTAIGPNTRISPLSANVKRISGTQIEVVLSDDETWNDGEFFFEIRNMDQF